MAIRFEQATGRVSGAGITARAGMGLLRLGSVLSAPFGYRGYSLGAKAVGAVLRSDETIRIDFADGRKFEFPYADGYWSQMLAGQAQYSPELEGYLPLFKDIDYVFVDCGANYGYMSVVATSDANGKKRAVAIEAHPVSAEISRNNATINGDRFEVLHNAVFHTSGETVNLGGAKHEARSILDESAGVPVETLALADLHTKLAMPGDQPVILKLDVEGVEIDALKGAGALFDHPVLVAYEEHGSDAANEVSLYLRDTMGMRLWHGGSKGDRLVELTDDAAISRLKSNVHEGYDLFATRDDLWIDRLEQIAQTQNKAGA